MTNRNVFLSALFTIGLLVGLFFLVRLLTSWLYDQSPAVIFVVGAAWAIGTLEIVRAFLEARRG